MRCKAQCVPRESVYAREKEAFDPSYPTIYASHSLSCYVSLSRRWFKNARPRGTQNFMYTRALYSRARASRAYLSAVLSGPLARGGKNLPERSESCQRRALLLQFRSDLFSDTRARSDLLWWDVYFLPLLTLLYSAQRRVHNTSIYPRVFVYIYTHVRVIYPQRT